VGEDNQAAILDVQNGQIAQLGSLSDLEVLGQGASPIVSYCQDYQDSSIFIVEPGQVNQLTVLSLELSFQSPRDPSPGCLEEDSPSQQVFMQAESSPGS